MSILRKLSIFVLWFFFFAPLHSNASGAEKFFATGHIQDLNIQQTEFFIRNLKPLVAEQEIIFVLGDSNLRDPEYTELWSRYFGENVIFVPGNHEVQSFDDFQFFDTKLSEFSNENFIFFPIISNAPLMHLKKQMGNWRQKYSDDKRHKVLLTHHRIWDDSILSAHSFKHDKTFLFKELYPSIENFIDTIIAGNSKRQHFQDLSIVLNEEPPDINLLYWSSKFNSTVAYNVGNGNAKPYATIVEFILTKTRNTSTVLPIGHQFPVSQELIDEFGLLNTELFRINLRDKVDNSIKNKIKKFLSKTFN